MLGASTADKIDLKRAVAGCRDGVTVYGITQFFGGSNGYGFKNGELQTIARTAL
jgi:hypothetical protein